MPRTIEIGVDPASDLPIAAQLRRRIAWLIAIGALTPGQRLPSIRGLARTVGVHHHTVRAAYQQLAADGLVSVRQGAGAAVLPYSSLQLARRPSISTSTSFGVLIAGFDPFYLPFLKGIESVVDEIGALMVVCVTEDSPIKAKVQIGQLIAQGVGGLIAVSVGRVVEDELRPPGGATALPIVYCDQPDVTGHTILFDGSGGMDAAASHLAWHGHRRVAFLTGPLDLPNVADLLAGLQRVVARGDLQAVEPIVVESYSLEAAAAAVRSMLARPDRPSGLIAGADILALGAILATRTSGQRVPEDMAVVGYGDIDVAAIVDPPLTSVATPTFEMGRLAMERLSRLANGEPIDPEVVSLPTRLVIRSTCGCAPTHHL